MMWLSLKNIPDTIYQNSWQKSPQRDAVTSSYEISHAGGNQPLKGIVVSTQNVTVQVNLPPSDFLLLLLFSASGIL